MTATLRVRARVARRRHRHRRCLDRGRRRAHHRRRPGVPPPRRATRCRAHAARARQRPQPRLPPALRGRTQAAPARSGRGASRCTGGRALDPTSYHRLATAVFAEMALAGITCVGEFHYLHHEAGGVPYADPNAMGTALDGSRREAGIRIALLDTCYLHGGIGVELDAVQRRFADGDALGWARASVGPRPVDVGDGPRRSRDPLGAGRRSGVDRGRGGLGRRARRPAARPRVGAAGRERAVPRRLRVSPDGLLDGTGARRALHGSARHARRRRRRRPAGGSRNDGVHMPDDRARPGRRCRTGAGAPRPWGRRSRSVPTRTP